MIEENVVLVDAADRETGVAAKMRVHRTGELHRAVSVFVFDGRGRMLLQRRALAKYHSGGRWANTCCSHPRPGESPEAAARRRLREEMGIDCALQPMGTFLYRADVGDGLVEHELDHLFLGRQDGDPTPDAAEVDAWRWAMPDDVARDLAERPGDFAAWFAPAFAALRAMSPARPGP